MEASSLDTSPSEILMRNFTEFLTIYDGTKKNADAYQQAFDSIFHPEWVIVPNGANKNMNDYMDRESALQVFRNFLEQGNKIDNIQMKVLDHIRIEYQFRVFVAQEGRVDDIHSIGIASKDGLLYQTQPIHSSVYEQIIPKKEIPEKAVAYGDEAQGLINSTYNSPADILMEKLTTWFAFFDGTRKESNEDDFKKLFEDVFHPEFSVFVGPDKQTISREEVYGAYKNTLKVEDVRMEKLDSARVKYSSRRIMRNTPAKKGEAITELQFIGVASNKDGRYIHSMPLTVDELEKLGYITNKKEFSSKVFEDMGSITKKTKVYSNA